MSKAPLLPWAVALCAGVLSARWIGMNTWLWIVAIAVIAVGLGVYSLTSSRGWIAQVFAILLLFCMGGLRTSQTDPLLSSAHWAHSGERWATWVVKLSSSPEPRGKTLMAKARVVSIDGTRCRGNARLYIVADTLSNALRDGDQLLIKAKPNVARQSMFVASHNYALIGRDSTSLRAHCEHWRMHLIARMQQGPLTDSGIPQALVLGWRADIDQSTQESFRDAGIAHLLAVSGMHVGLIAMIVGYLLIWLGRERKGRLIKGICQLLAVWGFTLLSGMAPSTLRAALMFSLFIIADITTRRTEKLNLLAAAAIIMLFLDPMLIHDVGWQLSFTAVGGILLAMPAIARLERLLLQPAALSTAATLATLPVVLATFHRLPIYFLIANVLIVPVAWLLLLFSLLYLFFPCMAVATVLNVMLQGVNAVTSWVQQLPYAVIENINTSPLTIAALALVALAVLSLPRLLWRNRSTDTSPIDGGATL